ncbi:AGAP006779-PA [Anopheles gambiae str. PEST]|uniref:AGAP006779-PA n=2 Tax=gambiae species complex TaxID=44542 RepID=Q5TWG6_ANOGA|nr:AGAP006779-PA [Anopheles gambiae str. PEST]
MNGNMTVKCEPISEEAELFNSLVAAGDDGQPLPQQDLRFLCLYRLKVTQETVELLEAQKIDVECLRKMRIEDVDVLFEGKPLGSKILFREAFLEWRDEIGLPCQSIKSIGDRKRYSEPSPASSSSFDLLGGTPLKQQLLTSPNWDECLPPAVQLFGEREANGQRDGAAPVSYRSFQWPMTPGTLKDVLSSSPIGQPILARGCLGSLSKSLQYQLAAIIIDYHMEFETKITTPQLENYAYCITTLFPHENAQTYHIPRGPNRRNPGGSLYSRFINQKISKKALAIGSTMATT